MVSYANIKLIINDLETLSFANRSAPFRYRWTGEYLSVNFQKDHSEHGLNIAQHLSTIVVGNLIETLGISCSHHGLNYRLDVLCKDFSKEEIMRVFFTQGQKHEEKLYSMISERRIDRGEFKNEDVGTSLLVDVLGDAKQLGVNLKYSNLIAPEVLNYLYQSHRLYINNENLFQDTFDWLKFDDESFLGMSKGTLYFKMVKKFVITRRKFKRIVFHLIQRFLKKKAFKLMNSKNNYLCFTAKDDSWDELIKVGRAMQRVWLALESDGVSVHPLSISSLVPFSIKKHKENGHPFTPREVEMLKHGHQMIKHQFQLEPKEEPVMLFRVGRSKRAS